MEYAYMQWKCPSDSAESVQSTATSTFRFPLLINHRKLTIDMLLIKIATKNKERVKRRGREWADHLV